MTTVTLSSVRQEMHGFGADLTQQPAMSSRVLDLFFHRTRGIGLSLVKHNTAGCQEWIDRDRTTPAGSARLEDTSRDAVANIVGACARGAVLDLLAWAPMSYVIDTAVEETPLWPFDAEGYLVRRVTSTQWTNYAAWITGAIDDAVARGLTVASVSWANEPDPGFGPYWSPDDELVFLRDYFGPEMRAHHPTVKVIAPDTGTFDRGPLWIDATLADPVAITYLDAIACHSYGSGFSDPSLFADAIAAGKTVRCSEGAPVDVGLSELYASGSAEDLDNGIRNSMLLTQGITGGLSAWSYWWLRAHGQWGLPGNPWGYYGAFWKSHSALSGPTATSVPDPDDAGADRRRFWMFGNWSRYVRPGWHRVEAEATGDADVRLNAFVSPRGEIAVVVTNQAATERVVSLTFSGGTAPSKIVPILTDLTHSLEDQAAVSVVAGSFSYTVPARSVVTLYSGLTASVTVVGGTASLSGTVAPGGTVSVSCPTATVGTVTNPTSTTWECEVTGVGGQKKATISDGTDSLDVVMGDPVALPAALSIPASAYTTTGTIDASSVVLDDGEYVEWIVDAGSGGTFRLDATKTGAGALAVAVDGAGAAPMTTASRSSGVAPLAVFFDAVNDVAATTPHLTFAWASGVSQPADMEGARFSWDFGDASSGTWETTGNSKNTATGYTAAHVYETPGTYTATLTVTDVDGSMSTYTQTVTVSAFAGTARYIAATAQGIGDGTSPTNAWGAASIGTAMTWVIAAANRALYFNRGDSFSLATRYTLSASGPNILGAYGTPSGTDGKGNRPILNCSALGGEAPILQNDGGNDWRITDIDMVGPGYAVGNASATQAIGPTAGGRTSNLLNLRVRLRNWYVAWFGNYWTAAMANPHDGIFLVDCDVPSPYQYGIYIGGRRLVLLGTTVSDKQDTGLGHNVRIWQAHKAVISNCALLRNPAQRCLIKVHAPELNTWPTLAESKWITITDNTFDHGAGCQWALSMGSQSAVQDEAAYVYRLLIERNHWIPGTAGMSSIANIEFDSSSQVVIRNNVFDHTGIPDAVAVMAFNRNDFVPNPTDVRVYNNTVYRGTAATDVPSGLMTLDATCQNVRVRNNLVGAPSTSLLAIVTGTPLGGWGANGNAQDHNLITVDPGFTNAGAGDFTLTAASPALGQGATLPDVLEDFSRNDRPSPPDLGAYERA